MNQKVTKIEDRAIRKQTKRLEKKQQIAESALTALAFLGYANTSLRDIADQSDLSLGMLHYYFDDKIDLILFCVSNFKDEFIHDVVSATEAGETPAEVLGGFVDVISSAICDGSSTHRLWYDIRSQAMFDSAFQKSVQHIEASMVLMVGKVLEKAQSKADPMLVYCAADGLCRYLMQQELGGNPQSLEQTKASFFKLLQSF